MLFQLNNFRNFTQSMAEVKKMENQNFKENLSDSNENIMDTVNETFENMAQDAKSDVHTDNQTSQQSNQNIINTIDEVAEEFNSNNPWRD